MALLTVAEVREYLPGLSGDDAVIAALVTALDDAIARWLGFPAYDDTDARTVEDVAYTLYLPDGDDSAVSSDGQVLYLPRPISSVTSIYDDDLWAWGSDTLIAATDYLTDKPGGRVLLKPGSTCGAFGTSLRRLKVSATCGFTAPPGPIKLAAKLWCAHVYNLRSRHGKLSISGGQVTESLRDETMPEAARQLLTPFIQRGALL
jgi:hypothetical protein